MIYPLFLDARPDYMQGGAEPMSLLQAPVGPMRLLRLLQASLGPSQPPLVLPSFPITSRYVAAIRRCCETAAVVPIAEFDPASYDPSDWLLFIDPRLHLVDARQLVAIMSESTPLRAGATHLVTMARRPGGTSEQVELGRDGRVRRIQRYFDGGTWPKLTGVACSLISASCLRTRNEHLNFESLDQLRRGLATRGVPSRDLPVEHGVFDLCQAGELVRLNERAIVSLPDGPATVQIGAGAVVHPTARVIGRVVLHEGAVVERGATIIGPSVIGARARVGEHAVVAQSVVGDEVEVSAASVLNYRAVFANDAVSLPSTAATDEVIDADAAPEIDVDHPGVGRPFYARVKVAADCAMAAVALVLLSPLFAIIAAVIRLDSAGSVFFADVREGCDGTLFRCWKFRTMRPDSNLRQREMLQRNDVDGPQFKLEKDPRLTRIGRWLRPMSLDELPQLFNVLLGQMSLIGPRPSPFRENQCCVAWREARLSVRPGITGLWQVCRHDRPGGDFHQWIYFDLLYVQHMSLSLDLKILLATLVTRGGQSNVPVQRLIPAHRLRT